MPRLLVDTHSFFWVLRNPNKLSTRATRALRNLRNEVFVSIITLWELMLKRQLRDEVVPKQLAKAIDDLGFVVLTVTLEHVLEFDTIPRHHGDPFDGC